MAEEATFPLGDLAATEALGGALANEVKRGDVIFLRGELGAGKTSLARGFMRHFFNNPELDVPSPSYLLHFIYRDEGAADGTADAEEGVAEAESTQTADGNQAKYFRAGRFAAIPGVAVHHLDPYRLPTGRIAGLVDFEGIFANGITLIEWPERLGESLVTATSPPRLELMLGGEGPQAVGRVAVMSAVGDRWGAVVARWNASGLPKPVPLGAPGVGAAGGCVQIPLNPSAGPETSGVRSPPADLSTWRVLGIESSCDDTGAAVLDGLGNVLGEALASQEHIHREWGGVVPKLAQQAHQQAIDGTVEEALKRAGIEGCEGLTAVAVTVGPGLGPCLQVGVKKAYELAAAHRLPIVRGPSYRTSPAAKTVHMA